MTYFHEQYPTISQCRELCKMQEGCVAFAVGIVKKCNFYREGAIEGCSDSNAIRILKEKFEFYALQKGPCRLNS